MDAPSFALRRTEILRSQRLVEAPLTPTLSPLKKRGEGAQAPCLDQSSGSTFTSAWSWLLPVQKVTGLVELSM
jgi:hypothetical protein